MTDSDILDFCEQHNVEVCFRFEKETNGYHLRIRRDAWQYIMVVTPEQIKGSKAWGSAIKEALHYMVDKLNQEENSRKAEFGGVS